MKFEICNTRIKVFAKAILTAGRYGEYILLDLNNSGVTIESVNKEKSAIFSVSFKRDFFTEIVGEATQLQMQMKSCSLAFRSPSSLEKRLNTLTFRVTPTNAFFDLEFLSNNVRKTVKCTYVVPSSRNHVSDIDNSFKIVASVKILQSGFQYFLRGVEYVLMVVTNDAVKFENYDIQGSSLRTNFKFERREFEELSVQGTVKLIFSLRSLKILLNFTDPKTSNVTLQFVDGANPVFAKTTHKYYTSNLVLATLQDPKFLNNANMSQSRNNVSEFNITGSSTTQTERPINASSTRYSEESGDAVNSGPLAGTAILSNIIPENLNLSPIEAHSSHSNVNRSDRGSNNGDNINLMSQPLIEENVASAGYSQSRAHISPVAPPLRVTSWFKNSAIDENIVRSVSEIAANIDDYPAQFQSEEERRKFFGLYCDSNELSEESDDLAAGVTDSEFED